MSDDAFNVSAVKIEIEKIFDISVDCHLCLSGDCSSDLPFQAYRVEQHMIVVSEGIGERLRLDIMPSQIISDKPLILIETSYDVLGA